jgi:dipeptide/tripeptide permease
LYFLPPFMGALADRIGFRQALILAFALLTVGYAALGLYPDKVAVSLALAVVAVGGAMVKPVISGTAAKCSDADNRARAFAIFYMIVNIGSFTGKSLAAPLRINWGLEYVNFCAAGMAFVALLLVVLFYRDVGVGGVTCSLREVAVGLARVVRNGRFMCLILIVAGFWLIQGQLYASMPKYITRLLGDTARPEWLANINPLVVVLLVTPITHLVRRFKAENAIAIGMAIIPLSALCVAGSAVVQAAAGDSVRVFGLVSMHPITLMVIIGIGLMGLAECFLSPKFLEFASKQAPEGQVGLYMGYQNLTAAVAWALGFFVSGFLLEAYCPDPKTLGSAGYAQWEAAIATGGALPDAYSRAHYIWYVFCAIGLAALLAMIVFKYVTISLDRRRTPA